MSTNCIAGHGMEQGAVRGLVFAVPVVGAANLGMRQLTELLIGQDLYLQNSAAMRLNDVATSIRPGCAGYDDAAGLGQSQRREDREQTRPTHVGGSWGVLGRRSDEHTRHRVFIVLAPMCTHVPRHMRSHEQRRKLGEARRTRLRRLRSLRFAHVPQSRPSDRIVMRSCAEACR
jgi:hypothetical protein